MIQDRQAQAKACQTLERKAGLGAPDLISPFGFLREQLKEIHLLAQSILGLKKRGQSGRSTMSRQRD